MSQIKPIDMPGPVPVGRIMRSSAYGAAVYSPCERYRYALIRPDLRVQGDLLGRDTNPRRMVNFVMLNPSTATEEKDDPTIARCVKYALRWGYGRLVITNLFALRSTDPSWLHKMPDSVGPENDVSIWEYARISDLLVCAWGTHGAYQGRGPAVLEQLRPYAPHALTLTKGGHPGHPLYLNGDLEPFPILICGGVG